MDVVNRPVFLEDVVANAMASLACGDDPRIEVAVAETVPPVQADPALLERVVANVVSNAVAWSPVRSSDPCGGRRRWGAWSTCGSWTRAQVWSEELRERVFEPFQRFGDRSNEAGVGLGLAVARGFVRAMGGRILLDDTPGGGLTVVIELAKAA